MRQPTPLPMTEKAMREIVRSVLASEFDFSIAFTADRDQPKWPPVRRADRKQEDILRSVLIEEITEARRGIVMVNAPRLVKNWAKGEPY